MKNYLKLFLLMLVVALLTIGCATEPTQEMTDAKAAVQEVVDLGQGKYAKDEVQKLNDSLTAALSEVEAKNYSKAKELLLQIKPLAEEVKGKINIAIEVAKKNKEAAETALNELKTSMETLKTQLAGAPKTNKTKADLEKFNTSMTTCDETLTAIQNEMTTENYEAALAKINELKTSFTTLSEEAAKFLAKYPSKNK